MRSRLNRIRNISNSQNLNIQIIKKNKERAESIKERLDEVNDILSLSEFYVNSLHNILITTKDKYSKYQKLRVNFAENSLRENIDILFPDRGFTPRIDYEFSRNKVKSSLVLLDSRGNTRTPKITEGGFLQQLIGYTSAISILRLLNSKTFYIDEAFSQASSENKEIMQNIIHGYTVNDNIQTILISQSPECYYQLPRREFTLSYKNGEAYLESVEDYESEFIPNTDLGFMESPNNDERDLNNDNLNSDMYDLNYNDSLDSLINLEDLD